MAVNWPGLLAWSTQHHDGTAPSQFKPMSKEDREFLEKAMEEAFGKLEDPNKVMEEAIQQIMAADRTDQSIITALEVIDKCCDDVDCARNVEKLNGLQPLLDLLESHDGPIRVRTLEILALLFSNNPHIQDAGFRRGAMKAFCKVMQECPKGSEERSKAFRALVALARKIQAFEESFLRSEAGIAIILSFLASEENAKTREKAASFIRSLAGDGRLQDSEASSLAAALAQLFRSIANESIQYREIFADCACELMRTFPGACVAELKVVVRERLEQLEVAQDPDAQNEMAALRQCVGVVPM